MADEKKEEKKNEKISPYDWEAFGFKIYDSDPESFFITSKSPIMQEVLKLIDANTDGDLDVEEFERVRRDQYVNAHLSKMICCHRSEWSYRGDSLVKLKNDASAIYDEIIDKASPETQEQKQKYLQLKDESIKRFEQKAKNLSFMCEFPEFKTQQLPEFCFYYFHPFAFVEQMKRMESCNKWHDPVEAPQFCKYSYGGYIKPWNAGYGDVRKGNKSTYHSGIDLFALPGTPVYACVNGIVKATRVKDVSTSSAGMTIRIKAKKAQDYFDRVKECNYKLLFGNYGEELGTEFKSNDDIYFIYMHLSECFVKVNDEVSVGQLIGKTGVSGSTATGTRGPHLHFEIANVVDAYGKGKIVRTNPARVLMLTSYNNSVQDQSKVFKYNQNGTKEKV